MNGWTFEGDLWKMTHSKKEVDVSVEIDGVQHLFEVKKSLHATRGLRDSLMTLAYELARLPGARGHLVLSGSRITTRRIEDEWSAARGVFSAELRERLDILLFDPETGETVAIPRQPDDRVLAAVREIADADDRGGLHLSRPDFVFETLKYLLIRWVKHDGPTPILNLIKGVGYSFPTAARALKEIESEITRHSDRSVELRGFPVRLWNTAIEWHHAFRQSVRFSDRSGQPRSPEKLLSRLRTLNRPDIAIGGVEASRWWLPDLDLTGNPRLDLVVHCPERLLNLEFVTRLDPALRRIEDGDQGESLVVHALQRRKPLFTEHGNDRIADPVECLLDLHEMRLENQADALINGLRARFAAK